MSEFLLLRHKAFQAFVAHVLMGTPLEEWTGLSQRQLL